MEKLEALKHKQLEKFLFEDKFKTHYICNDIKDSDLYSKLLKGYESMIILRLSALNELDLGYILILNEKKIEYEYNDIMKDFRYKLTLVAQHFSVKESERRKAGSLFLTKASLQNLLLTLDETTMNARYSKEDIRVLKRLSPKPLIEDERIEKAMVKTIADLEKHINDINKSLDFKKNDKLYQTASTFKYIWIKEKINSIKDSINELPNCKVEIVSDIRDNQEFYGKMLMLETVLKYCLNYLLNKTKETDNEVNITINSKIENYKLVISILTDGLDLDEENLKKGYKNETQTILLQELQAKKELKVENSEINITYYLNILKLEDRKDRHLHYKENRKNRDSDKKGKYEERYDNDIYKSGLDIESGIDEGVETVFKKLKNTTIDNDIYKD